MRQKFQSAGPSRIDIRDYPESFRILPRETKSIFLSFDFGEREQPENWADLVSVWTNVASSPKPPHSEYTAAWKQRDWDQLSQAIASIDSQASAEVEFNALEAFSFEEREFFRNRVFESRSILELPEDWDDCGTAAFSEDHWTRVTDFLLGAETSIWSCERKILMIPAINPVSGGSIDIHWKTETAELLINVPPAPDALASFYGDNFGKRSIKGQLELTEEDYELMVWLRLVK